MFNKIWQWIKNFFQRLFGGSSSDRSRANPTPENAQAPPPLTDTDYDFLFNELLEGIARGWTQDRILQFFEGLGERGTPEAWQDWLRRFGDRLMRSRAPNNQLAARMIAFGDKTRSLRPIREVGALAKEIGTQLLSRHGSGAIWEYDGPDAPPASGQQPQVEQISLDDLVQRMQQDPNLVRNVAQQLGLDTTDVDTVVRALQQQLAGKSTTDEPPADDDAEGWAQRGLEFAKVNNFEEAVASWDKAVAIKPDYHPVWYNRGRALINLGRFEEAIASHDRALELQPDDHLAWQNRGEALGSLGRWQEAFASFDNALEFKPDDRLAWYNLAEALVHLGRMDEALSSLDQAIKISPEFYDAWNSRGNVLRDLGLMEEANASWEKAKEIAAADSK
ncbi:MAG: tetratricopeptide repeat protein [Cyanobacteriota bacterium]|nr:tetratricopeptide repeat protein [Cyanobacteriota bacterium]